MALADYIKVDLSITSVQSRAELVRRLRQYPAQLVAERVETPGELALARSEGFTLFQGYYFCRPMLLENRAIPANRLVYLEILHALHESPLNTTRVSDLVKRDASLTYRLLRMVNSPLFATRKVVTSIHGALVMIGDEMFRQGGDAGDCQRTAGESSIGAVADGLFAREVLRTCSRCHEAGSDRAVPSRDP